MDIFGSTSQTSHEWFLDILAPWISQELIAPARLDAIRNICQNLPLLSFGCFECWLDESISRVDLDMCATWKLNEHRALLQWIPDKRFLATPTHQKAWEGIRTFCHNWSLPDFSLNPLLNEIWIVYDIEDSQKYGPVPWIYISFKQFYISKDPILKAEIACQVLPLIDKGFKQDKIERFREFIRTFKAGIQFNAIGVPTLRKGNSIKLYLILQTWEEVIQFLKKHQWPGDFIDLQSAFSPIKLHCDFYGLCIEWDEGLLAKIGIELCFLKKHAKKHLTQLTEVLMAQNKCSPAKRTAMLNWEGEFETVSKVSHWSWPESVRQELSDDCTQITIRRMLRYIKMVYEPGQPMLAKAYLFFNRKLK